MKDFKENGKHQRHQSLLKSGGYWIRVNKMSIFPGKYQWNFDIFRQFSHKISIFQANFLKIFDLSRQIFEKIRFSRKIFKKFRFFQAHFWRIFIFPGKFSKTFDFSDHIFEKFLFCRQIFKKIRFFRQFKKIDFAGKNCSFSLQLLLGKLFYFSSKVCTFYSVHDPSGLAMLRGHPVGYQPQHVQLTHGIGVLSPSRGCEFG